MSQIVCTLQIICLYSWNCLIYKSTCIAPFSLLHMYMYLKYGPHVLTSTHAEVPVSSESFNIEGSAHAWASCLVYCAM